MSPTTQGTQDEPTTAAPQPRSAAAAALVNMAWLLGDKALALVIGLLIFGLIGRTLGPVGSGHFAYATALLQTGLTLSMVCAGVVLLPRFCLMVGRNPKALAGAIANVFVLRMMASLVAMAVLMVFTVLTVEESDRRMVTLIMLLAIPLIEPFYIFATYWQACNNNRPTVIARSTGLLLRCAVVLLGVYWGAPPWVLATAWLLEAGVNAGMQTLLARPALPGLKLRSPTVRPARMARYLQFGLRFVLALWLSQLFLRLDRLLLAQWLSPHDFGIYAAPMQLVEVWSQVAYLIGSSIASAYLYKRLGSSSRTRAFLLTATALAGIGVLGFLGAWLLGPLLLQLVFGSAFAGSAGFLMAGAAVAILLFVDQAVDMLLMADEQSWLLTLKWAVALTAGAATLLLSYPRLGAYAGPAGLAAGIVVAWLALLLASRSGGAGSAKPVHPAVMASTPMGPAQATVD
jgi:O-antigen/teichoic acid export membrane protein